MNKRYILTAFALLVLATLACNRTVPTPTPRASTPVFTPATDDGTPTIPEDTGTPTVQTQVPPLTTDAPPSLMTSTPTEGTPACIYDADFVTDVTIPDDTELESDTAFVKTWRMRNSGTCAWEPGTLWTFDSGDKLDGPDSVQVPIVEPGNTVDIAVHLAAPDTPGTYTGYWIMLRPDGERLGTLAFLRIVVLGEEDEVTPTASATPTSTLQASTGPVINYFRSDVQEADPGDTIALEWETVDAANATLYHLMPTGQLGSFWEVGVNGAFDYEIDESERNHTDFLLIVNDDEGHKDQATLSISLRCPDTWFFEPAPDECPASPAVVSAGAEEHFEHGTVVWVQAQDLIYVLFDDGQSPWWRVYPDEWDEGEPDSDPGLTPPSGLFQPERGFGLIWREEPGVRDRLGWAVDTERAFSTAVQRTSRAKYNDTYVGGLDTKVWKLLPEGSGWEQLP